jgi:hypothetical protein
MPGFNIWLRYGSFVLSIKRDPPLFFDLLVRFLPSFSYDQPEFLYRGE